MAKSKTTNSTISKLATALSKSSSTRNTRDIDRPVKGMMRDASPLNQPPTTYRMALNMQLESREGDYSAILSEEGNQRCFGLPEDYVIIGTMLATNNETIIFSTNEIKSEIGIVNELCEYTPIIQSSCLSFTKRHPIKSLFRIKNGCDRIIYFTDNFNPYRAINLDQLISYTNINPGPGEHYTPEEANTLDEWNCNLIKAFSDFEIPCIGLNTVTVGGSLRVGIYQFAIRYLNNSLNPTDWIYVSQPIDVLQAPLSTIYNKIDGGDSSIPNISNNTNKSIFLDLSELDQEFAYVELAVIRTASGSGIDSSAFLLPRVAITGTTTQVTYVGESDHQEALTIDEIVINRLRPETVQSQAQIDNRLVLGNVTEKVRDWSVFQREASKIGTGWITSTPKDATNINEAVKGTEYYFENTSYMRDEIYAFGITYVFEDGTESPVFHIPGRPADCAYTEVGGVLTEIDNADLILQGNLDTTANSHTRNNVPALESWDRQLLTVVLDGGIVTPDSEVEERNVQHIPITEFTGCASPPMCAANQNFDFDFYDANTSTPPVPVLPGPGYIRMQLNQTLVGTETLNVTITIRDPLDVIIFFGNVVFNAATTYQDLNFGGAPEVTYRIEIKASFNDGLGCFYGTDTFNDLNVQMNGINPYNYPISIGIRSGVTRIGCQIERWKVHNTATYFPTADFAQPMSFYECTNNYPELLDCVGDNIWGEDICGNVLVDTPIRHHKFPDTNLVAAFQGETTTPTDKEIIPIGLHFFNISYPTIYLGEIQGHYIVRVKRSEFNKTVLDKGIMSHCKTNPEVPPASVEPGVFAPPETHFAANIGGWTPSFVPSEDWYTNFLITPKVQFEKGIQPSYLKFEGIYNTELLSGSNIDRWEGNRLNMSGPPVNHTNRIVDEYVYVDAGIYENSFGNFPYDIYNQYAHHDNLFVHLPGNVDELDGVLFPDLEGTLYYISIKEWRRPYCDVFRLVYQRTHNCLLTDVRSTIYGGDTYIGEFTYSENNTGIFGAGPPHRRPLTNFFMESQLNSELRSHGAGGWEQHYRYFSGNSNKDDDWTLLVEDNPDVDISSAAAEQQSVFNGHFKEFLYYNPDWSKENDFNRYFPLPIEWDYCSDCEGQFPTRILYSNRAYQEEAQDNYLSFLANNYRDLLGESGDITNLFVYKDELYSHTQRALWFVPTRPQEVSTNESNLFIGTGDVLSVPPKRLESVDRGYAGSQDDFATIVTEFGTLFIDAEVGKVFNFSKGSGLLDISAQGMRNWFVENLPVNIRQQIQGFKLNTTTHPNGAGFVSCLDPRHNRIIITKKDYKLLFDTSQLLVSSVYEDTTAHLYGFNTTTGEYYTKSDPAAEVIIDIQSDPTLTEQRNWTISFNLPSKSWASFHSYRPVWMWNNRNHFYSFSLSVFDSMRHAWKHGTFNYGEYYEVLHPSVLHMIFNANAALTKIFNTLNYIAHADRIDGDDYTKLSYDTFNQGFVYTSDQASGIFNILSKPVLEQTNPFTEILFDPANIRAAFNEHTWSFSDFHNMVVDINLPILTKNWNNLTYRQQHIDHGYIEYPNPDTYDFAKGIFQLEPMRDKWMGAFLIYENNNNYKFTIDFVATLQNISFR